MALIPIPRAAMTTPMRVGLAAFLSFFLLAAVDAHAQCTAGSATLGAGDIYVYPEAAESPPSTTHCSFTGAMNQAITGTVDRGCAADQQCYGGGATSWTEIDIPPCDTITLTTQAFLVSEPSGESGMNIAVAYEGDQGCNNGQGISADPYRFQINGSDSGGGVPLFEVEYGAVLQFVDGAITNFARPVFAVGQTSGTGELDLEGAEVYGIQGQQYLASAVISNWGVNANVNIYSSYFHDNTNTSKGGALFNKGTASVSYTAMYNNAAVEFGGAISNSGNLTVSFCTLYMNTQSGTDNAGIGGGAIYNDNGGTANITWSTILANTADASSSGNPAGGIGALSGNVSLKYSILSKNKLANGHLVDCSGTPFIHSQGFNLLDTCGIAHTTGDIAANVALGVWYPDSYNNDWTQYIYPSRTTPVSPAIDAVPGSDPSCNALFGGAVCNIGEYQPGQPY